MQKRFIPLSVPNLKGKELEYVTEAITTEWVSSGGPFVDRFEKELAAYTNAKGAVACQNGTAGLHIGLLLCGVEKDEEVLVPTLTFIAAVNPVRYVGAEPVFMDCDSSLCMDPKKVREFLEKECSYEGGKVFNKKTGRRIRALIVVHVFGNMADMEALMEIAHTYGLKVIEDATEALGTYYTLGTYKNKFSGTIGHVGVYSFNGNKIITTGGGGMIVSQDQELLDRARYLTTQAKNDVLYYQHDEVGYNYRMTNVQAAIGLGQLESLEAFIETKTSNYEIYKKGIESIDGLSLLSFRSDIRSNKWFYSLYVESTYPKNRDELMLALDEEKIQTRPIWRLNHEQKPYLKNQAYEIDQALNYWQHIINIPCSTNLLEEDLYHVVQHLQ